MKSIILILQFFIFSYCYSEYITTDPTQYLVTYPAQTIQLINQGGDTEHKGIQPKDAASLFKLYQETKEANEFKYSVYKEAGSYAIAVIDIVEPGAKLFSKFTGMPGAILTGVSNEFIKNRINGSIKSLEDEAEKDAKQILISSAKKLYTKDPLFFTYSTDEQYRKIMEFRSTEDLIVGQSVDNQTDNAVIQTYMMRSMRDDQMQNNFSNIENHNVTQSMIDSLKKQGVEFADMSSKDVRKLFDRMKTLTNGVIEIEKVTQRMKTTLVSSQNNMVKEFNKLTAATLAQSAEITQTNGNVLVIKEFMFSQMSYEDQLKNIDKMKDVFKDTKRAEMKEQIGALKARADFEKNMSDIFQGGNLAVDIASKLGVPPKFARTISTGLAGAEIAKNLVMNLTAATVSPLGILGCASSLLGLFGSQKDPAAERHKEIMAGISDLSKQMREQNEVLLGEIVKIEKGLQAISTQIIAVEEKLNTISKQLNEININLTYMHLTLEGISEQIRGGFYQDYEHCRDSFIKQVRGKTYYQLESIFSLNTVDTEQDIQGCVHGFRSVFEFEKASDYVRTFVKEKPNYLEYNIGTSLKLIHELINSSNGNVLIGNLVTPNDQYWALKLKLNDTPKLNFTYEDLVPLDNVQVSDLVKSYLEFYPLTYLFAQHRDFKYFRFLPPGTPLAKDFENPGFPLKYLSNALTLVQMAIAEYNLISGDVALFPIVEKMYNNPDKDFLSALESLMYLNPTFAHNFLIVYVNDWLERNNSHPNFYQMALDVKQAVKGKYIMDKFGLPFKFHFDKDGAYFELTRVRNNEEKLKKIYMPNVYEINDGTLQALPELLGYSVAVPDESYVNKVKYVPQMGLLQLRNKLLESIADIRTMEKVRESKDTELKRTFVNLLN